MLADVIHLKMTVCQITVGMVLTGFGGSIEPKKSGFLWRIDRAKLRNHSSCIKNKRPDQTVVYNMKIIVLFETFLVATTIHVVSGNGDCLKVSL